MIIDTEALRDRIREYEDREAELIDRPGRPDREAIAALTRAETRSIKRSEAIEAVESLVRQFMGGVVG
jgi:hypothetical protein